VITQTVDAILNRALTGEDISPEEGVVLLHQTEPTLLAAIQETADQLRYRQTGDVVTYVINRNINFSNICEQHCSFCAFRRDAGEEGAYWLDWGQIQEKTTDAVRRGATEICMQGGLNPEAKINGAFLPYYQRLVKTIKMSLGNCIYTLSPRKKCSLLLRMMGLAMLL
jgi:FO synthase subunit 2